LSQSKNPNGTSLRLSGKTKEKQKEVVKKEKERKKINLVVIRKDTWGLGRTWTYML